MAYPLRAIERLNQKQYRVEDSVGQARALAAGVTKKMVDRF